MSRYSFKQLAFDVLELTGRPMEAEEIWAYATDNGMAERVGSSGKTPARSIQAQLYTDIKDHGEESDFVQTQRRPVLFTLRSNYDGATTLADDYTVADLIRDTLEREGRPLTCDEIWDTSSDLGLHERLVSGRLPKGTLNTRLNSLARKDGSGIAKVGTRPVQFSLEGDYGNETEDATEKAVKAKAPQKNERDLHPLLTTFVNADTHFRCHTKTIHHEESKKGPKGSDRWSYPDLVGIYYPFDSYEGETVRLIETMRENPYVVYSFEMKWKVETSTLREQYFQAVSNSSWANEGYLVAPEISSDDAFRDDLARLVNAFGIGVIRLDVENVEQSEILYPAKFHEHLDWATIDRLVSQNRDFKEFIADINADAKTNGVRGKYDKPLSPERYDEYIATSSVAALLNGQRL